MFFFQSILYRTTVKESQIEQIKNNMYVERIALSNCQLTHVKVKGWNLGNGTIIIYKLSNQLANRWLLVYILPVSAKQSNHRIIFNKMGDRKGQESKPILFKSPFDGVWWRKHSIDGITSIRNPIRRILHTTECESRPVCCIRHFIPASQWNVRIAFEKKFSVNVERVNGWGVKWKRKRERGSSIDLSPGRSIGCARVGIQREGVESGVRGLRLGYERPVCYLGSCRYIIYVCVYVSFVFPFDSPPRWKGQTKRKTLMKSGM